MKQRKDLKVKFVIDSIGVVLTFLGLGGLGGASEGHGSFIVAVTVFAIGFGIVLWGYQR